MFAEGANEVFGKFFAFVNISANRAAPAFFNFRGLGFGFDVALIISVSEGILGREDFGCSDVGNEHGVGSEVDFVHDFSGNESVYVFGKAKNVVFAANGFNFCKFIGIFSASEAEVLEDAEGGCGGKYRNGELTGAFYHIVGQVKFVDGHADS